MSFKKAKHRKCGNTVLYSLYFVPGLYPVPGGAVKVRRAPTPFFRVFFRKTLGRADGFRVQACPRVHPMSA